MSLTCEECASIYDVTGVPGPRSGGGDRKLPNSIGTIPRGLGLHEGTSKNGLGLDLIHSPI